MKLHLSTSLRAALLCALCCAAVYAEETSEVSNRIIIIDKITEGSTTMPSDESKIQNLKDKLTPDSDGVYTLSGNDRLGAFTEEGKELDLGKYTYDVSFLGKVTEVKKNVTKNVKVDGTLLVSDDAQVYLGGQYAASYYKLLKQIKEAEYTGIIADTLKVQDSASVYSYGASVDSLVVTGGTVTLHDMYAPNGNSFFVADTPQDSKQVSIKKLLQVDGGTVNIGHNDVSDYYLDTAFGSLTYTGALYGEDGTPYYVKSAKAEASLIKQSAGELNVKGGSTSVKGLNIEQSGGKMNISVGSQHDLADYGDSTITQSGDTSEMTIGKIVAYNKYYDIIQDKLKEYETETENTVAVDNNPKIELTQKGAGKITLNGVDFTAKIGSSKEKSSLNQEGGGTITLNGAYQGATFDIKQTGTGKIELASGATMTANQVTVGGTMNVNGSLNLEAFNGSAAGLTVSGTLNVTGSLTLNGVGATITLKIDDLSQIVQEATTFAAATGSNALIQVEDGATFNATDAKFELLFTKNAVSQLQQYDLDALKLELISGVDADKLANTQITLSTEKGSGATAEDLFGETSYSFSDVTNGSYGVSLDVQNTAAVPEPTTATLSLLALAGLCARRRRR